MSIIKGIARFVTIHATSDEWEENKDFVLYKGEKGVDTTIKKEKIGDGVSTWENLEWLDNVGVGVASVEQTVTSESDNGINEITVTLTDGKKGTFSVRNGSKGSTGLKGDKGDKGETGERGPQGIRGERGLQGIQGERGLQGEKGEKGDPGPKGDKGDIGEIPTEYINNNFSGSIKITKSGNIISANDVSPIEHDVDVKVIPVSDITVITGEEFANKIIELGYGDFVQARPGDVCMDYRVGSNFIYNEFKENTQYKFVFKGEPAYSSINGTCLLVEYTDGTTSQTIPFNSEFITEQGKSVAGLRGDGKLTTGVYFKYEECGIYKIVEATTALENVTVSRYGKNLLSYPYEYTTTTICGVTFTDNGDGTITANGTATARAQFMICSQAKPRVLKAGTYFLSGVPEDLTSGYSFYFSVGRTTASGRCFTLDKDTEFYINISVEKGVTVNNVVFKPQIELGTYATDYEPYTKTEYTANADGTVEGVKSISPSMTLIPDTSGVLIVATYNADTKMYIDNKFNELATALINS